MQDNLIDDYVNDVHAKGSESDRSCRCIFFYLQPDFLVLFDNPCAVFCHQSCVMNRKKQRRHPLEPNPEVTVYDLACQKPTHTNDKIVRSKSTMTSVASNRSKDRPFPYGECPLVVFD